MSRFTQTFTTERPQEAVEKGSAALYSAGFRYREDTGTWQKGKGLLTAPQLASLQPVEGGVELEAWLRFALLPGVYLGEFDLEGSFMLIPKRQLRKAVTEVVEAIQGAGALPS